MLEKMEKKSLRKRGSACEQNFPSLAQAFLCGSFADRGGGTILKVGETVPYIQEELDRGREGLILIPEEGG